MILRKYSFTFMPIVSSSEAFSVDKHFYGSLAARRGKGITDKVGKEATPAKNNMSKYERGKKALATLTGQPEKEPKSKSILPAFCCIFFVRWA